MASYEPGRYRFKITNQGFGESKTKGTPFFFLEGIPEADDMSYPRTITLYITDKTADTVAGKLKGIGWLGGKWSNLDPNVRGYYTFVGLTVEAICTHEPGVNGDGKLYDRFDLPFANEREPQASDASVAAKLDKLFGKAAMPAKGQRVAPGALQEAVAAVEGQDEIPF